jgi:hypothetical protein
LTGSSPNPGRTPKSITQKKLVGDFDAIQNNVFDGFLRTALSLKLVEELDGLQDVGLAGFDDEAVANHLVDDKMRLGCRIEGLGFRVR